MEKLTKYPYKFIVPLVFLLLPLLLPQFTTNFDTSDIIGPTTFIFSVLTGFFLADATANYRRLKLLITDENAALVILYKIANRENPKQAEAISAAIDEYMIAQLDYPFLDHVEYTYSEFDKVVNEATKLDRLDRALAQLIRTHQEMYMIVKRTVGSKHSTIIVTLGIVLMSLLLLNRGGSLIVSALIGVILFSIYEAIFLLFDLDSNRFLSRQLAYKTPQYVFSGINKLPYYPETAITGGIVEEPQEVYRVGVYTDSENSYAKEVRTIEL